MSANEPAAESEQDHAKKERRRKPLWVAPRLVAAPKIRQVLWCDFWQDAMMPEMWKERPVIVLSFKNSLQGVCSVVACSTDPQEGKSAQWAHPLSVSLDGQKTFVVCNHICTVSASRLSPPKDGIPRLAEDEFHEILRKTMTWLPQLPEPE